MAARAPQCHQHHIGPGPRRARPAAHQQHERRVRELDVASLRHVFSRLLPSSPSSPEQCVGYLRLLSTEWRLNRSAAALCEVCVAVCRLVLTTSFSTKEAELQKSSTVDHHGCCRPSAPALWTDGCQSQLSPACPFTLGW